MFHIKKLIVKKCLIYINLIHTDPYTTQFFNMPTFFKSIDSICKYIEKLLYMRKNVHACYIDTNFTYSPGIKFIHGNIESNNDKNQKYGFNFVYIRKF